MAASFPLESSSSWIVSGPTRSGKSVFVKKLITQDIFKHPIVSVLYCFGVEQPLFIQLKHVMGDRITFHEGLPDEDTIDKFLDGHHRCIVIDDLAFEALNNSQVELLFTRGCHHRNATTILITQNLFHKSKFARTVTLNANYIVLFKNIRDTYQISFFSRQLYGKKSKFFEEAYKDATSLPFGYILIDLTVSCPDLYRLRKKNFLNEDPIIYISSEDKKMLETSNET